MAYVAAAPALTLEHLAPTKQRWHEQFFPWAAPPRQVIGTVNGRSALWLALAHCRRAGPVVVPAFTCPSVVAPLRAAGRPIRYYDVDDDGAPRMEQVATAVADEPAAVLLLHYCGFPNAALADVAALAARHGVPLVEDCAHAALSADGATPLGAVGAASIFSLRKSCPVPDGGALVLNTPGSQVPRPASRPPLRMTLAGLAYLLASATEARLGLSLRTVLLRSRRLRRGLESRDAAVRDAASYAVGMSRCAAALLARQCPERLVHARRENYRYLQARLRELRWLQPPHADLPAGVCPFGFPILSAARDRLRAFLFQRGINARVYWNTLPDGVTVEQFPGAWALARQVLVLPVHQSLDRRDLDAVVAALREFRP